MADLSTKGGQMSDDGKTPLPLRDKKYLELDRDNFNDIMKSLKPTVALNGGSTSYTFESLEDFSPIRLLQPANTELNKVDSGDQSPLGLARADYERRTKLSDIMAKLDGNIPLQKNFIAALRDKDGATLRDTMLAIKAEGASQSAPPELKEEQQAVIDAQKQVDDARKKLAAKNALDEANKRVDSANASLTSVKTPPLPSAEQTQLSQAEGALADAQTKLADKQKSLAKQQQEADAQKRLDEATKQLEEAQKQLAADAPVAGKLSEDADAAAKLKADKDKGKEQK
jgi:type VI secretion system protein ImpB